jgi:hypothetical protein
VQQCSSAASTRLVVELELELELELERLTDVKSELGCWLVLLDVSFHVRDLRDRTKGEESESDRAKRRWLQFNPLTFLT